MKRVNHCTVSSEVQAIFLFAHVGFLNKKDRGGNKNGPVLSDSVKDFLSTRILKVWRDVAASDARISFYI